MTNAIVILGKRTVRKTEIPHLEAFGHAMFARNKQLITTRTQGVASIVANAYASAGGTPQYLSGANYEELTSSDNIIVFTDTKYQEQLDENTPDWQSRGWLVIHNPKATEQAAQYLHGLLTEWGTAGLCNPDCDTCPYECFDNPANEPITPHACPNCHPIEASS